MKRIIAVLLCIFLCVSFCVSTYAEADAKVVTTELSVTLGESIDLKPFLSNCFGSATPAEYRFVDGENANGVIQNGIFTPATTDSAVVTPVFANGSDTCNGYRQIMVVYVVNRPGQNGANGISLRSGQSYHLLEVMPIEYRLSSLPVTFHVIDPGQAEPELAGDLLTVTDKPVSTVAIIKAVMQDGIAPGQDSEYEIMVEVRPDQTVPIFASNGEAVLCGERIDIRNYLHDDVKPYLSTMNCNITNYSQHTPTLDGWYISSEQPGIAFLQVTIPDYYGNGLDAEASLGFQFCEPPATYDTGRFDVHVENSFDLVNELEEINRAWLVGGNINNAAYECNSVDYSKVSFEVIDQGQTGAEIVNDRTVVFSATGEAVVRAVMKDDALTGGSCNFDFVFSVYDNKNFPEFQFFEDVPMPVPISTQTSQYLGVYVEIDTLDYEISTGDDYDYYDGLKVEYAVKDAGTTNARISDRVLYAPYEGTAVVTITAKDAFGKGRDYSRDLTFAVEKKDGFVTVGEATWDYYTGRLMQGTPAEGVSYNASSHTLVLNNAVLVAETDRRGELIQADHDLVIQLNGSNYLFSNIAGVGSINVCGYNNPYSASRGELDTEYIPGAGKLVFCGSGSLVADGSVGADGGVIELVDTDITSLDLYGGYICINNSQVDTGYMNAYYIVVDGKDSYVRSGNREGYGIHFEYTAEHLTMNVRNGTVIAYGGVDWAYNGFGGWGFGDSSGYNLMPRIHPSYTNARVWMGHTEEEANARGALPQKVLQPYNFYEYIRIAPIEENEPVPTPVPPAVIPPQTGDAVPLFLYAAICMTSTLYLLVVIGKRCRKTN